MYQISRINAAPDKQINSGAPKIIGYTAQGIPITQIASLEQHPTLQQDSTLQHPTLQQQSNELLKRQNARYTAYKATQNSRVEPANSFDANWIDQTSAVSLGFPAFQDFPASQDGQPRQQNNNTNSWQRHVQSIDVTAPKNTITSLRSSNSYKAHGVDLTNTTQIPREQMRLSTELNNQMRGDFAAFSRQNL